MTKLLSKNVKEEKRIRIHVALQMPRHVLNAKAETDDSNLTVGNEIQ